MCIMTKLYLSLLILVVLFGFASSKLFAQNDINNKLPKKIQQIELDSLQPVEPGSVRIIFYREPGIVGGAVQHYLFDKGYGIKPNAVIFQKDTLAYTKGKTSKSGNVVRIYLKINDLKSQLVFGSALNTDSVFYQWPNVNHLIPGDAVDNYTGRFLLADTIHTSETINTVLTVIPKENLNLIIGRDFKATLFKKSLTFSEGNNKISWASDIFNINYQSLVPNAQLLGFVKSGETLVWDRDPGTIQFEYIDGFGYQTFCPAYKVEAGNVYLVEFNYGKASYTITKVN